MTYPLAEIVKKQGKTKVAFVAFRPPPLKFEKELRAILRRAISEDPASAMLAIRDAEMWLRRISRWNRDNWARTVLNATGVDLSGIPSDMASHQLVIDAFAWLRELILDLQRETAGKMTLARASTVGRTKAEQVSMMRTIIAQQQRRAQLIAHDQSQKIGAKLNEAQQREAGVNKYKWNHSFLPNARRHHVERQGNIYSWDRPPRGGHPGTEINCRCTAAAII